MTEATLLEAEPETEDELQNLLNERPRYDPQASLERLEERKQSRDRMLAVQVGGMSLGLAGFLGGVSLAAYGLAEGNPEVAKGGGAAAAISGSVGMMSVPTSHTGPSATRRLRGYTLFEDQDDAVRDLLADSDHVEHDYHDATIEEISPEQAYDRIRDGTTLTHAVRTYEEDGTTLYDVWVTAEADTVIETIEVETDDGRTLTEEVETPANPIEDGETYHFAGAIDDADTYLEDLETIHGREYARNLGYETIV